MSEGWSLPAKGWALSFVAEKVHCGGTNQVNVLPRKMLVDTPGWVFEGKTRDRETSLEVVATGHARRDDCLNLAMAAMRKDSRREKKSRLLLSFRLGSWG